MSVFLILVLVVLWGVGGRYLFGTQASWSEELARLLMVWLALLGSALVCREENTSGSTSSCAWPQDLQRLAQLFGYLAILHLPSSFLVGAVGNWSVNASTPGRPFRRWGYPKPGFTPFAGGGFLTALHA